MNPLIDKMMLDHFGIDLSRPAPKCDEFTGDVWPGNEYELEMEFNRDSINRPVPDCLLSIIALIRTEYFRATKLNGPFHSAHEGYAVILEEMDELKMEVWKKASERDAVNMVKEAVQVAAMAIRFINDVCMDKTGTQE